MPEITFTLGATYRIVGKDYVFHKGVPLDVDYETAARLAQSELFVGDVPAFTPSTFTRDPSEIGGENCTVTFDGYTATVSGEIAYYPEDLELERPAGHRLGFEIKPPDDLEDVEGATYDYEGKTGLIAEDTAQNPRVFWWYPLVEADTEQRTVTVDWNSAARPPETFTVVFGDVTLQEPEQNSQQQVASIQTAAAPIDTGMLLGLDETVPAPAYTVPDNLTDTAIRAMGKADLIALAEAEGIDISECKTNPDRASAIIIALRKE